MPHNPILAFCTRGRLRHRVTGLRSAFATALALISVLALASSASALEQQLGVAGIDAFGASVAVQGDTLVIGTAPQPNDAGAAYVYQRTGDTWNQTAKLVPSDSAKALAWSIVGAVADIVCSSRSRFASICGYCSSQTWTTVWSEMRPPSSPITVAHSTLVPSG